ncbi:MAG TPA: sigma-70 family RNA polymerase sigma factor [Thermoanaerobaculia bacterium]|jgi:RNA polymerase sigma factor (sigma-70 family)|nr:sigma-70 family RNA polymerase sigma factor [Thermoanaerobaculia bacterium]
MGPNSDDDGSSAKPATGRVCVVEDAYRDLSGLLRDIAEKKFHIPPLDAAGVVNEVFTSFMLRQDSIRDPRQWLIGAACHASRAYWRTAGKTSQLPLDYSDTIDPDSSQLEGRIVDRVTMARALEHLGPKCRETLQMYYAEGYSAAEIAVHFGTTVGYVNQLLHTCRKRVKQAYDALREGKR